MPSGSIWASTGKPLATGSRPLTPRFRPFAAIRWPFLDSVGNTRGMDDHNQTVTVKAVIPAGHRDQLLAIAARERRSLSGLIAIAIELFVEGDTK